MLKLVFLETGVSGHLWSCLKELKPLVVYDVEMRDGSGANAVEVGFIFS